MPLWNHTRRETDRSKRMPRGITSLLLLLLLLTLVLTFNVRSSDSQRLVGTIYGVSNAGLLNVYTHGSGGPLTTYSILAGTYDTGRSTYDNAFILYHPGLAMSSGFEGYGPRVIYNQLYWPKELSQVPSRVFSFDAVSIPDGSTIIGKTSGSIYISNVNDFSSPITHDILKPILPVPSSYMYSGMVWLQADSGSTWDIITCRFLIDTVTETIKEAQLVWISHPSLNEMGSQWSLSVLKESACDSNVDVASLSVGIIGGNYDVIYATGYHLQRLVFFYTTSNLGRWTSPSDIVGVVIEQGRQFNDVKIVDINNDGRVDILTTVVDRFNGTVEVWEIPSDFRNPTGYVCHVIASGFAARAGSGGGRAPGVARAFLPNSLSQQKPWIALSGADDGRAYVLRPISQDPTNWNYQMTTIADYGTSQTVSGIAVADVDADGYIELFVSVHNLNYVQVFSYSP